MILGQAQHIVLSGLSLTRENYFLVYMPILVIFTLKYSHSIRQTLLAFFLTLLTGFTIAQSAFVTTWNTEHLGVSDNHSVRIPVQTQITSNPDYFYNFEIDWGDGVIESYEGPGSQLLVEHTYPEPGVYTISISGVFPRINFGQPSTDLSKILEVQQWGNIQWESFGTAFRGCNFLSIPATDTPDLSNVTDMNGAFWGFMDAGAVNSSFSEWDVSNVTNMNNLFRQSTFNQPIGNWDVSNVTSMNSLFYNAFAFNQPIDAWDVSSVTNMTNMFCNSVFNQPIGSWDVSSVTSMNTMFLGEFGAMITPFNQPIEGWNVSSVENMGFMFSNCMFNQPIEEWDVTNVQSMQGMFQGASFFNQSLGLWDISTTTNVGMMLNESGIDPCNYNKTLEGWSGVQPQQGLNLGAAGVHFTEIGEPYREILINDFQWTINDAGVTQLPDLVVTINQFGPDIEVLVSGGSGVYQYLWSGPDDFSSTGSFITAEIPGIYTVWVSDGCSEWTEDIEVLTVGVDKNELNPVTLYPNPASDQVFIQSNSQGLLHVEIFNPTGALASSHSIEAEFAAIDIQNLSPGLYICRITVKGGVETSNLKMLVSR